MAANTKVLVTGINGFIGAHVALSLLKAGYHVRGAVRTTAKGEDLLKLPQFSTFAKQLAFIEVPNISEPGAFDDAVKDVQVIIHLASPFFLGGDYDSTIAPAKNGTASILNSVKDHASADFQHFILYSSIAAQVRLDVAQGYTYTEEDWSTMTEEFMKNVNDGLFRKLSYFASKGIAERVFWDFVKTNEVSWSATALLPALVYGPVIHAVPSPEKLNTSTKAVWDFLAGNIKDIYEPIADGAYVDVRDLARITTYAVEHPKDVAGKRFSLVAGSGPTQAIADILREDFPDRQDKIPEGTKGEGYRPSDWKFTEGRSGFSPKAIEALTGSDWIPFDVSIRDTVQSFKEKFGSV